MAAIATLSALMKPDDGDSRSDPSAPAPSAPAPSEERCSCEDDQAMRLTFTFGWNPVHCLSCGREVQLKRLAVDSDQTIRLIAYWRDLYGAVYRLWLDSNEYEEWAKAELCNIRSRINALGREVQRMLSLNHRCYYWFFQDEASEDHRPATTCPGCGRPLDVRQIGSCTLLVCEGCSLVGAG